jgi:hypothetical protein
MTIAVVGTPATQTHVGAGAYTITISPTAGNSLYVLNSSVSNTTTTSDSVSDNIGGTSGWNKIDGAVGATVTGCSVWRKDNIPAGITTLTITTSGSSAPAVAISIELSSTNTTNSQDAHNIIAGTGTNPTSPSVTTNFTNELAIGYMVNNSIIAPTAGTGYGGLVSATASSTITAAVEFQSLTGTTSLTAPFIDTANATGWVCGIVTVKGTTSGGGRQSLLACMGMGS